MFPITHHGRIPLPLYLLPELDNLPFMTTIVGRREAQPRYDFVSIKQLGAICGRRSPAAVARGDSYRLPRSDGLKRGIISIPIPQPAGVE